MNFYAGLPTDFATRIRRIIEPYVLTERQRIDLITEAFYTIDPRIGRSIEYSGTSIEFARHCTNHLIQNVRCLIGNDEHSISRLLRVLRDQCGLADQTQIDAIITILDPRCKEKLSGEEAVVTSPPATVALPDQPLQTEKTPPDRRTPTVFVSYSHRDSEFAQRLIIDLQRAGHAVWIDVTNLKGGDEWIRAIAEGILNSYAFLMVVTPHALESKWVQDEVLWAKQRERLIIPLILDTSVLNSTGFFALNRYQYVRFDTDYDAALPELLSALPSATIGPNASESQLISTLKQAKHTRTQRESELEYLDRLKLEVLLNTEKYTALAGQSQIARDGTWGRLASVVMRPEFALLGGGHGQPNQIRRFDNAVDEILALQRVVLLGDPGAGKTTTMWRLASDLAQKVIDDPEAPIPLVIRLGRWTDENQGFKEFIQQELGNLGPYLDDLLQRGRAALLFDGLNEIPVSQRKRDRADKDRQVERFIRQHSHLLAVVSCRAQDFKNDLGFHKIEIQPLDPIRIREFLIRYLDPVKGNGAGDTLFWQIAGGPRVMHIWQKWQAAGASLELFFVADDVPIESPNVYKITRREDNKLWQERVRQPSSFIVLASNPYMLIMLAQVYQDTGELPQNRGKLFHSFVATLLAREKLVKIEKGTNRETWTDEAIGLLQKLAKLAFEMQIERARGGYEDSDALTVLPLERVNMSELQLKLASSASLLIVGDTVRFTHQLLQEYFVAVALRGRVFGQYQVGATIVDVGRGLRADTIWQQDRWWERTNWEEAAVLFAGLYPADASPVIEWLMDANPEVAADCIRRSGAHVPREMLLRLRERWIPRMTDLQYDPSPLARAAVGHALGMLKIDGEPLDNRKGVSFISREGIVLPDIHWCEVPAGEFLYQDGQKLSLPAFQIARYPITYSQFQVFIDDPDGIINSCWWDGLVNNTYRRIPDEQWLKYSNHPRDYVSWYDAIAFCRWLSWRLGGNFDLNNVETWAVRLPTEYEWEKTARGENGLVYPYGDRFDSTKANTEETGIGQTSAVGVFPYGVSPYGVMDMSGNVWEWCFSAYNDSKVNASEEVIRSDTRRVVRGGSWYLSREPARATTRYDPYPVNRSFNIGFRLCRHLY